MSELFAAQPALTFPQSLTEKYQPKTVDEFVGLDKAKKFFHRMSANPFASAWLFLGSSGTGKTTLALALKDAIPAELHHIPSQECNVENLERVRRICQYVPQAGCKVHMILIDEADQMTSAAQLKMLSYADATNFPPNTIIILTANATDRLEPRFYPASTQSNFPAMASPKMSRLYLKKSGLLRLAASPMHRISPASSKDSNNNVREAIMRLETEMMTA
jgi:DNA polymerase III delta prime subunit